MTMLIAPVARNLGLPPRYRLSVDQYERMIEAAILGKHDKIELLDGEMFFKHGYGPAWRDDETPVAPLFPDDDPAWMPPRFRLSVERYERMVELGILDENDKVELIDGELRTKMPIGSLHSSRVTRWNRCFHRLLGARATIRVQDPVRLPGNVPEPDLAWARNRVDDYEHRHPTAADLQLVVEVADSTREYDLGAKAMLYAAAGVPEYWVVDLPNRCVWAHRGPQPDGTWTTVEAKRPGDALAPQAFPDAAFDLAELFA